MSLEKYIRDRQDDFDDKQLSNKAQLDFEQRLQEALHTPPLVSRTNRIRYMSIAASILVVLGLGYFYGNTILKGNNKVEKDIVLALNHDSASKRLEAVYQYDEENKKEDKAVLQVLFKLLLHDKNNNVRIATIEALAKYTNNESVRLKLIEALNNETEPLVQIKLIQSLSMLREQRIKKSLQQLIDDKDTYPEVKGNASLAMIEINKL